MPDKPSPYEDEVVKHKEDMDKLPSNVELFEKTGITEAPDVMEVDARTKVASVIECGAVERGQLRDLDMENKVTENLDDYLKSQAQKTKKAKENAEKTKKNRLK